MLTKWIKKTNQVEDILGSILKAPPKPAATAFGRTRGPWSIERQLKTGTVLEITDC